MELSTSRLAEICSTLFDVATEAIFIVNKEGIIELANPATEDVFEYKPEELIGQNIKVLIPREKRGGHDAHRESYHSKPSKRKMGLGMDLNGLKKNGDLVPIEISLSNFMFDEKPFVMTLITDISNRKAAEQMVLDAKSELEMKVKERTKALEANIERQKLAEMEIQKAYEQEKELNELKSRFVSMASHEFKTPLANILTSATLIDKYQDQEQSEKRIKHVGKIKKSVSSLNAILNDFLSLDRVESGAINFNEMKFDFVDLCEDIIDQLELLLKDNQKIVLDNKQDSVIVNMDKNAMKHVVGNLLSNAVKYSEENSTIYVGLNFENDQLSISVKDEGIGIPIDEQKNMFSKFFRAKNSLNIQGTGLGLHIIKYYIEIMNGSISFQSTEGEGTTFSIKIPCKS